MKTWINPFPSYQGYRPGAGAGYLRYDNDSTWYVPAEVKNGNALPALTAEALKAKNANAFYGTRLIWNHVGTNRSVPGTKVLEFRRSDGKIGYVHDIRDTDTLDRMMEVEQIEHDAVGHLYDFRQFGFGILNENNFFGHDCPFTTREIAAYYSRMLDVWGRKLMICVGGSSTYMEPFLTWVAGFIEDFRPQAVYQDNFMREGWSGGQGYNAFEGGNMYSRVESWLGYKPLIWWCEVSGGPNGQPDKAENAYKMFLDRKGVFFANMGAIPNYPETGVFAGLVADYAPERLKQFLEWSQEIPSIPGDGGTDPIPPDPSDLEARVEALEEKMRLQNELNKVTSARLTRLEDWASRNNF